jgi:protocatechuate 3,4-dioxygenase beta subunit
MRHFHRLALAAVIVFCTACLAQGQTKREPIIGGPCEGCEYVFEGMPATIESTARIAPTGERGDAMRILGVVRDRQGKPVPGIIVYAYQTDAGGIYPSGSTRHGRLRGWAKADSSGRYRFDTIRPGGYPNSDIAQHVHMHVIEPGRGTYFIDDVVFTDDPRLTPDARKQYVHGRGGPGLVTPARDKDGVLIVTRDIILGEKIPGYGK